MSKLSSTNQMVETQVETKKENTPPKFKSSPLKNGGWKTILSYWEGIFSVVGGLKTNMSPEK